MFAAFRGTSRAGKPPLTIVEISKRLSQICFNFGHSRYIRDDVIKLFSDRAIYAWPDMKTLVDDTQGKGQDRGNLVDRLKANDYQIPKPSHDYKTVSGYLHLAMFNVRIHIWLRNLPKFDPRRDVEQQLVVLQKRAADLKKDRNYTLGVQNGYNMPFFDGLKAITSFQGSPAETGLLIKNFNAAKYTILAHREIGKPFTYRLPVSQMRLKAFQGSQALARQDAGNNAKYPDEQSSNLVSSRTLRESQRGDSR